MKTATRVVSALIVAAVLAAVPSLELISASVSEAFTRPLRFLVYPGLVLCGLVTGGTPSWQAVMAINFAFYFVLVVLILLGLSPRKRRRRMRAI